MQARVPQASVSQASPGARRSTLLPRARGATPRPCPHALCALHHLAAAHTSPDVTRPRPTPPTSPCHARSPQRKQSASRTAGWRASGACRTTPVGAHLGVGCAAAFGARSPTPGGPAAAGPIEIKRVSSMCRPCPAALVCASSQNGPRALRALQRFNAQRRPCP
ncbi:MAG: hypothetical protein J3K34DRAFT_415074 [Monoraphidium minutum]|nr:MAG: hypothetical protein J3K34DRAFT_415074 [Monoraphidium minutum]